jgi:tetratricopeptide (TPR) repeat protein
MTARPRNPGWRAALWLGAILAAVAGGGVAWRKITIAHGIPVRPAATALPPALADELAAAEQAARSFRRPIDGLVQLSRLYHANGLYPQALQCYATLEQQQPREARWPHLQASIHASFGRVDDALPLARRAVRLDPDYLPARIRLGDILTKADRGGEAAQVYAEALRHHPGQPYALLGLARLDLAQGDWARARAHLQEAIQSDPDCIGALSLLVTVATHDHHDAEARALQQRIAGREHRDLSDPWLDELNEDCYDPYRLGVAAAVANISGDGATARRWLERAVELQPDSASSRRLLAKLLNAQRDFAGARRHLERALALEPGDGDAWVLLVEVLDALGATGDAERALRAGLTACPQSGALHYRLGRRLAQAGRTDQAIAALKLAKQYRPSEAAPYLELAQLYFRLQQIDDGLAEMRGALVVQPGNPLALQVLTRDAILRGDEAAARRGLQELRALPRVNSADLEVIAREFAQQFGHAP